MSKNTILSELPNVNGIVKGSTSGTSGFTAAVANVDYQVPVILTTSGTSGVSTFNGTTLNIPNYGTQIGPSGSSGTSGTSGATGSSGTSGTSGTGFNTISPTNSGAVLTANGTSNSATANTGVTISGSTLTAGAFYESSSVKGKNIIDTNPELSLNIDVIKYIRKNDENKDVRYGYSAEQIHSLMPELTNKDVTAVKYLDVHTILIAELQKKLCNLEDKLRKYES